MVYAPGPGIAACLFHSLIWRSKRSADPNFHEANVAVVDNVCWRRPEVLVGVQPAGI